jgi:multicomponent Na+:H+ antiporter subunit G
MDNFVNILSMISLVLGSFFILSGSLGLLKLPDLFGRIHAAGLIDTLGSGFIVLSLILYSGFSLVSFKLLLIHCFYYLQVQYLAMQFLFLHMSLD